MVAERWSRERIAGAFGAALLELLIGYVLISGFSVHMAPAVDRALKLFDVAPPEAAPPPPPREKVVPRPRPSRRREGAAAPPNLRARPTEVVVPPPAIPLVVPPPIVAAKVAGPGNAAAAGAAEVRGPGTGAGGVGTGTGSGDDGTGDGGGDETPPRRRAGRIRNGDFPAAALQAGAGGTVSVRYTVETDGRATHCIVTASSGNAALDETTCRLIEKRFRFDPSRDADGRPVSSTIVENHVWEFEAAPPPSKP